MAKSFIRPPLSYRETIFTDPARNITLNLDAISALTKQDFPDPGGDTAQDQYRIVFYLSNRGDDAVDGDTNNTPDNNQDEIIWAFNSSEVRNSILENIERYIAQEFGPEKSPITTYKG